MLTNNEAPPRRRPIWKVVLTCLGIFAGILIVFLVWLGRLSDRQWRDMEVRVGELRAEYQARIRPRPVLRGVAVPGNAWDDYLPAINRLSGPESGKLAAFILRGKYADRAAVEVLLSEHGPLLDQLRMGAGREEGQFPWDWEAMVKPVSRPWAAIRLSELAICQARFHREAGRIREAVDLLLDVAQLGRDLGDNGSSGSLTIGFAIQSFVFDELREFLSSNSAPPEDAGLVACGLELLDRNSPRFSATLLNEALFLGCQFLSDHEYLNQWGLLVMPRLRGGHAFFDYERWMRQAAEAEGKSWREAHAILGRFEQISSPWWNPLVGKVGWPQPVEPLRVVYERRAQLRLLRLAAQYRASGQIPELEDPFGTKLLNAISGDKLRFWSVWTDGVDDGGIKGGWKNPASGDLILEIER